MDCTLPFRKLLQNLIILVIENLFLISSLNLWSNVFISLLVLILFFRLSTSFPFGVYFYDIFTESNYFLLALILLNLQKLLHLSLFF